MKVQDEQAAGRPAGRKRLAKSIYEPELLRLQRELVKLQDHVRRTGAKICVIFEGREHQGVRRGG